MTARLRRSAVLVLAAGAVMVASGVASGVAFGAAPRVGAACARADAERLAQRLALLPGPLAHVHVQVLPLPGPLRLRWAALSWGDPPDGAVVVLDCAGRPLAAEPVGPILHIRPGPTVAGRPTLQALYRRNGEASLRAQSVALVRFAEPGLAVVWRHEITDLSEDPLRPGRGIALSWRWRFSSDGRVIRVAGERAVGALSDLRHDSATGVARRLRPQAFCWIPGRRRFDRCAP
jgi:hypothetical protein